MKNGLRQSCPDEFLELAIEREHISDSPSLTLAQLAVAGELQPKYSIPRKLRFRI